MTSSPIVWKEYTQAVAIHEFQADATDDRDLKFSIGDIILVVKLTKDQNWVKGQSLDGRVGLVPTTYIRKREAVKLHSFAWFHGRIEREFAEVLLKSPPLTNGKYLVRESIRYIGDYTLSLLTVDPFSNEPKIDHYRMLRNLNTGTIYIDDEYQFDHIYEIINFYKKQAAGLAYKLTVSVDSNETKIKVSKGDFERSGWKISRKEVQLLETIGSGEFAEVWKGKFRGCNVAIKKIKREEESEKVLAEASILTELKHKNLIRLVGVVTDDPVMMAVEYCDKGSLLDVLITQGRQVITLSYLLDFSRDVLEGMVYLEGKSLQHRDLACRNVLVDDQMRAKISDFGLAQNRNVTLESGKHPIKWTAPEAVNDKKYTNKSDVWSYGVFLWELFSYGRVPYPSMQKEEVVKNVIRGYRMPAPQDCPGFIYETMLECWNLDPNLRPSFKRLREVSLSDKKISELKSIPAEHSTTSEHLLNMNREIVENTYESVEGLRL